MEYQPVEREDGAFQRGLAADTIETLCRRAFGPGTVVASAVELGGGMYNNTYRVGLDRAEPVILRVAPEPGRQFDSERELMRNEYATLSYLTPIAPLLPIVLAVDFTHEIIGRDYLFQSVLPGVPAPDGLDRYPRPAWASFYRQLGTLTRQVQSVRGNGFGRVSAPIYGTWGDAILAQLAAVRSDIEGVGLNADDIDELITLAARHRAVLDEVTEPRLLHGDLWTGNVMINPDADAPTITGVFDGDRAAWGDPEADWSIFMAGRRPGTEREAFWEGYGALANTRNAVWRRTLYRAQHVAAVRLEHWRLGKASGVAATYVDLKDLVCTLDR